MRPGDTAELRKARGAFFTPPDLARYVTEWAVRSATDRVLEPSCGEAAFLLAAGDRLQALGQGRPHMYGHELHVASADEARRLLSAAGCSADIGIGDFFTEDPEPEFDAVIGNPPYVRYQDFTGASRANSKKAALRAGVTLTGLASSWAAFTVHAALFLKPGGRLGLVLPAELLSVNYAAEVRSFLMRRFGRVRLVLFQELVFPGVLEEVVLLLAEGVGGTDHMELLQVQDVAGLSHTLALGSVTRWRPERAEGKWTQALLPATALDALDGISLNDHGLAMLSTWGATTLGAVTGNNSYFALSMASAKALKLPPSELVPLSPPGSRHLRTLSFTKQAWQGMAEAGARVWLFRPSTDDLSKAAKSYVQRGEAEGIQEAYKCAVRTPWWRVPTPPVADLLLTYMNADTPRLSTNAARVRHLNSVHGLYLHEAHRGLGRSLLSLASLNTMTLLGAEVVGRAYGGGMLKLEPGEADQLPMPSPGLVLQHQDALQRARPKVAAAIRRGELFEAVAIVDQVLLMDGLGMTPDQVAALEFGRASMMDRRAARGRGSSGE